MKMRRYAMNKILKIFFVMLTILTSATASNGATNELTKLLESRDFWSSYKWENFEDSELYKSTTWKLSGSQGIGDTKISDDYSTPIRITNLYIEGMVMYVNTKTKEVNSFDMYAQNKSIDNYTKFVSWCNEKFGDVRVENKTTRTFGEYIENKITSSWSLENTIVRVETITNLSNGPKSEGFITTLSFSKKHRQQVNIINEIQPKKIDHEIPEARAVSTEDLQRNNRPTQSMPISRSSEAVPRSAAPAVASSRSITSESSAVKPIIEKYLSPPYIWDDELGTTHATNDIQDVPEYKRALFEINVQK